MEPTVEQIENAFDTISPELQKAIDAVDVGTQLQKIGTQHKLMIDQLGTLNAEVMHVILGLKQASDLRNNILRERLISPPAANEFMETLDSMIFRPIKEQLEGFKEEESEDEEEAHATPTVTTPEKRELGTGTNIPINRSASDPKQPDRKLLLEGIENPTTSYSTSLVKAKLEAPHAIAPVVTDHTVQNITPSTAPPTRKIDPYRELPEV